MLLFIFLMVQLYQKRMIEHQAEMADKERELREKVLEATLEVSEAERKKIASNLHDDLGMIINVVKINFSRVLKEKKREEAELIQVKSSLLLDECIQMIRNLTADLSPKVLIEQGVGAALCSLCNAIRLTGKVKIRFEDGVGNARFQPDIEVNLFRLIKELLNNTIKHAAPSRIEISLKRSQEFLNVTILHNGMGITTEQIKALAEKSEGLGLKSIFTRADLLRATLSFEVIRPEQAMVTLRLKVQA